MQIATPRLALAKHRAHINCRSCNSTELEPFINLGWHPLPDFGQTEDGHWKYAQLAMVRCDGCGLVQLRYAVERDDLFRKYWYRSGTSETMREELKDVANAAKDRVAMFSGDAVVDIGSNDGTLLSHFPAGIRRLGFEPCSPLATESTAKGIHVIDEYFSARYFEGAQKPIIVFSIAMMYSVNTPREFVADVARILSENGLWIIQMNDLQAMVENLAFDIIGHEHVCLYSLLTLETMLVREGLEVFRVERRAVNGGSIRVFVQHKNGPWPLEANVEEQRRRDFKLDLSSLPARVEMAAEALQEGVSRINRAGQSIHICGASTRGCSILHTAHLDDRHISMASDRDEHKWGKLFPGTQIPIVSEEESRSDMPDFYLVLPYSYINHFMRREKAFRLRGGRFIVPLPEYKEIVVP